MRVIGSRDDSGHFEVYYRPPRKHLEPRTLLAMLRKRLLRTCWKKPSDVDHVGVTTGVVRDARTTGRRRDTALDSVFSPADRTEC